MVVGVAVAMSGLGPETGRVELCGGGGKALDCLVLTSCFRKCCVGITASSSLQSSTFTIPNIEWPPSENIQSCHNLGKE